MQFHVFASSLISSESHGVSSASPGSRKKGEREREREKDRDLYVRKDKSVPFFSTGKIVKLSEKAICVTELSVESCRSQDFRILENQRYLFRDYFKVFIRKG